MGLSSERATMPTKNEQEFRRRYHRQIFYAAGSQYYTMARFAMHAQCIPVCGNLFFRSPRTSSPMRAFSSTVIFPIIVLRSPPSVEVWEPERDLSLRVLFEMPRNRPVKCRVPPKISVIKPSTALLRPPVPLRGRCATPSKISHIRLQRSRSRSDGCAAECTVRFDLERCVFADERHLLN